ncbi:MAG: hypothetical protein HY071_06380 [Chloroflexi bacterium]|nr:hypothetical protein [Chloroflexota bacterium]
MSDMDDRVVVRARGTSWGAILGGWVAAIGVTALLVPLFGGTARTGSDLSLAVPGILSVLIAYLVGGYVAGRMAGWSTSWHGMLTAFFGLFVVLVVMLLGVAADRGVLGGPSIARVDTAYAWAFGGGAAPAGDALTFSAIMGFLGTIFAGWLGGLLAPSRYVVETLRAVPVATAEVERTTVVREPSRPAYRLLPAVGRKGGDRVEETRVERTEHGDLS